MMSRLIVLLVALLTVTAPVTAQGDTPPTGNRLFFDDFSTLVHNWDRVKTAKSQVDYIEFAYHFSIRSPGIEVWSMPRTTLDLERYVIQVSATVMSESDGIFGLLLNYQDDDNFLVVGITENEVEVRRRVDGEWETLESVEVEPADSYQLWVQNDQGALEIRVNDSETLASTQHDLSGGSFGLYAQAGRGTIHVAFDDYLVHDLGGEA